MYPVQIALSSYSIVGLTLVILAGSLAIYLLRLATKTRATWSLILFFGMVTLSGGAIILTNGLRYWGDFFRPWQDFWILAGGVALAHFAYTLPEYKRTLEAGTMLGAIGGLAFLALLYSATYSYRFLFAWTPELGVSDSYYLLLPVGILVVVLIFLRRAVQFSGYQEAVTSELPRASLWQRLIRPQGEEAIVFRNLALALSLSFLPALQTLMRLPGPYGFVVSNIGALLATTAIALVYFNYAPDVNSFMAKLVGITLATVMLIFAIFGTVDVYDASSQIAEDRLLTVAAVRTALGQPADLTGLPGRVAYVVSWDASRPAADAGYRQLYQSDQDTLFDLQALITANGAGEGDRLAQPAPDMLNRLTGEDWGFVWREQASTDRVGTVAYLGYAFEREGTVYEIGLSQRAEDSYLSANVARWLLLMLASSAFILLVFPLFFRGTLVRPMERLLSGIRRVNAGDLDTFVPVQYGDQIGTLTDSFNQLAYSLKISRAQQDELVQQLKSSQEELEERVTDRTRQLSAFTDLTMLSGEREDLAGILQPALSRLMDVGLCEALCIHLLSEDRTSLELVAQRTLPDDLTSKLERISLSLAFAEQIHHIPYVDSMTEGGEVDMPDVIRLPSYAHYFGSPLMAGDRSHGWLSCYCERDRRFSASEISLLVAMARQIGVIVENQRLRQRIQDVAAYEERERLARDLHDSVTQLVFGMTLFTRAAREALDDGDTQRLEANLSNLSETSTQVLREMRFMLFELQPPSLDEAGLAAALGARFDMVERRVGIVVDANIDPSCEFSREVERELYYVAIEALNNTLKHARADQVALTIAKENGCLHLLIVDNGQGFDLGRVSPGLGIRNMQRRAEGLGGDFWIDSAINKGTKVEVTIPVAEQ